MFYRRKVVLALLQALGGEVEKTRLQKILFLFSQRQQKPEYNFIPYKYGCFSYSAYADFIAMESKQQIAITETGIRSNEQIDYIKTLKENDKKILREVIGLYGKMSNNTLIRHTYINYPFFAINSVISKNILTSEELIRVEQSRPDLKETALYTIGYEGISLEEYLTRLIKNDIKVLVDVRRNPLSQKYGFNKNQLSKFCENLGILYIHFPEVGISSEYRQELTTQVDYDNLFKQYVQVDLPKNHSSQYTIYALLKEHKRIALTCFESNICQCHRKPLAEAIMKLTQSTYHIRHI